MYVPLNNNYVHAYIRTWLYVNHSIVFCTGVHICMYIHMYTNFPAGNVCSNTVTCTAITCHELNSYKLI